MVKNVLTANDMMVRAHFVHPSTSIVKLKRILKTTEDTLLVLDKRGRFLGEIHEYDLLKLIVPERELSEEDIVGVLGMSYTRGFVAKKASDLMHRHNFTATPDTPLPNLALIMYREEVKAIPIVKGKKIVGVVHLRNLINAAHRR